MSSWVVKPASARARKEWETASAAEPELMKAELERLKTRPLDRSDNPRRTARLKGPLGARSIGGTKLPQWQREITGSGRIWYCPDRDAAIVWITKVSLAHPKETER